MSSDFEAGRRGGQGSGSHPPEIHPVVVWLLVVVAVVGLVALWRHHHRHAPHGGAGALAMAHAASAPSATGAPIVQPGTNTTPPVLAGPDGLALEVWVRDPEVLLRKIVLRPGLDGSPPPPLPMSIFSRLMKSVLPPDAQDDADILDEHLPLGVAVFDGATAGGGKRFVLAAAVKPGVTAAKASDAIAHVAKAASATVEHSTVLGIDVFKSGRSGLYLALVGKQIVVAADLATLELGAPMLGRELAAASTQAHDVIGRSPQRFLSASMSKEVGDLVSQLTGGAAASVGGGVPKLITETVIPAVQRAVADTGDLDFVLDLDAATADATATLHVAPMSAASALLLTLPTVSPEALLAAPRDAIQAMAFRVPTSWLDAARAAVKDEPTPTNLPAEIPKEVIDKSRTAALGLLGAVDGDVLFSEVQDGPPTVGAGAMFVRIRLRDEALAKTSVHDLLAIQLPPGITLSPFTVEGGAGEALETPIPADAFKEKPMGAIPQTGVAYVIKHGYLYAVQGTSPKLRLSRFASENSEDHLGADPAVASRVAKLPTHAIYARVVAPLRADTPMPALNQVPPLAEAVVMALEATVGGVVGRLRVDLELGAILFGPALREIGIVVTPTGAGQTGGGPGGAMPGTPSILPGLSGGGGRRGIDPAAGRGGGRAPSLPAIAPSGFQLEVPHHHVSP